MRPAFQVTHNEESSRIIVQTDMSTTNFCPKCNGLLQPKISDDELLYACNECNHRVCSVSSLGCLFGNDSTFSRRLLDSPSYVELKEEMAESNIVYRKNLEASWKKTDTERLGDLPSTKSVKCPKCGNEEIKFFEAPAEADTVSERVQGEGRSLSKKGKVEEEDAPVPTVEHVETGGSTRCMAPPSTLVFVCCNSLCFHRWRHPPSP